MDTLSLTLKPHIEREGYHLDRFDAFLGDDLVVTSNQPVYDGARALLKMGYKPEQRMCAISVDGHRTFEATIGENAKWTVHDNKRTGLQRVKWQPHPLARARV